MTETGVRPEREAVKGRDDPGTDRVVALPNATPPKQRRRYGGMLVGAAALLLLLLGIGAVVALGLRRRQALYIS